MKSQLIPLIIVIMLTASILPSHSCGQPAEEVFSFEQYNDYLTVKNRLENLTAENPDICKMIIIGQTFEGRDIITIRLTDNPDIEEIEETDMLIMGGHHGNELPSVEVPMYILEFLAGNYSTNSSVKQLVDSRDIWFIPLLNPDGREYALNVDAGWRKNRRPIDLDGDGTMEGTGVDLNRNYGHLWGELPGTSHNIADRTYCGPSAFSEAETQAIRTLAENQDFKISLSYHTYGEVIYYPWNNNIDTISPEDYLLEAIAQDLGQRTGYNPMKGVDAYPTTGDSDDWLYAETDCLPFTIELGTQYVIPEIDILALCQKNLDAALFAIDIADKPEQVTQPDWTFMVYMSADADKSLADEAIVDLNEMEVAGSNSDLNIIVLYDGPSIGDTAIYHIQKDSNGFNSAVISPIVDDLGHVIPASNEVDMSKYYVMSNFVNWTMANYPAQNYFLDIWGHGDGVLGGFAYDRGNLMGVNEISQALEDVELNIVGFDSCSMGHFEVVAELADISDILIGSESEEPISGWNYIIPLQKLIANTNMKPEELASIIVQDYLEGVTATYVTLAAIDINVFQEKVLPLLNEFTNVSLDFAYEDYEKIWITRNYTDTFINAADAVDLFEYLENLGDITISDPVMNRIYELLALEDELVIASGAGIGHPDSQAMAVYFPALGTSLPAKYRDLDFAENLWDEYLEGINNPIQKPVITASRPEPGINSTDSQSITAELLPSGELEIHYRVNSGIWNIINMNVSGNDFYGLIPGQANGSIVEYYFLEPDANITEPYEVKWGSNVFFNYTVSAACDPAIIEFTIEPDTNLENGDIMSFTINYTNFGPDYTLVNLTLEARNDTTTALLYWEHITIQPGELFIKRINWTAEAGEWNITAQIVSVSFQDNNLSNNLRFIELNVAEFGQQSSNNSFGDDYAMIIALLILVTMIPLIAFMLASRNARKKQLVMARKRIISARSFVEMANEFGGNTTQSKIMLVNAEMALKRGKPKESETWSRKARDEAMNSVADKEVK